MDNFSIIFICHDSLQRGYSVIAGSTFCGELQWVQLEALGPPPRITLSVSVPEMYTHALRDFRLRCFRSELTFVVVRDGCAPSLLSSMYYNHHHSIKYITNLVLSLNRETTPDPNLMLSKP